MGLAEGEGVEPLALPRCQPGVQSRLLAMSATFPWWAGQDSNLQEAGFRPAAFTDFATSPMVLRPRFELGTNPFLERARLPIAPAGRCD